MVGPGGGLEVEPRESDLIESGFGCPEDERQSPPDSPPTEIDQEGLRNDEGNCLLSDMPPPRENGELASLEKIRVDVRSHVEADFRDDLT